jgi:hypothetical protein
MKKLIFWTAITFTFFLSSAALADYVIKLKNGRSLPTSKFWEEKEEIKFYWANGIAEIPKEDIEKPEGIPPEGKKTSESEAEIQKIEIKP